MRNEDGTYQCDRCKVEAKPVFYTDVGGDVFEERCCACHLKSGLGFDDLTARIHDLTHEVSVWQTRYDVLKTALESAQAKFEAYSAGARARGEADQATTFATDAERIGDVLLTAEQTIAPDETIEAVWGVLGADLKGRDTLQNIVAGLKEHSEKTDRQLAALLSAAQSVGLR